MSFNITPVASGYQEIHPYSAMNIDSVKINTSLIMMKEWRVSLYPPFVSANFSWNFVEERPICRRQFRRRWFLVTHYYTLWHFKDHMFYRDPPVKAESWLKISPTQVLNPNIPILTFSSLLNFYKIKCPSVLETFNNDGLLFQMCTIMFLIERGAVDIKLILQLFHANPV